MQIYVARHGESTSNINNLVCGHSDVKLTQRGEHQAKLLAEEVSKLKIDRIISSPLNRAYQTARIVAEYNNLPLTSNDDLIEFNFGDYEGEQVDNYEFLKFRNHLGHKMPNGESILEASQRIYNFLDEIKNQNEQVLLVSHNAISRVINSYFNSVSNSNFYDFNLDNCELLRYTFNKY